LIRHVQDRPGHDRRYAMDVTKARHNLGFEPEVEFEQGLRDTVDWYLEHRDWCRAVQGESHKEHLEHNYGSRLGGRSR
jgi:dTDP-glucose 4,6-dehydratase